MSTLIDTPTSAFHEKGMIVVTMASGGNLRFPCSDYPRLAGAKDGQLADIELSPFGLHWPQLDEDLSIRALIADHSKHPEADHRPRSITSE